MNGYRHKPRKRGGVWGRKAKKEEYREKLRGIDQTFSINEQVQDSATWQIAREVAAGFCPFCEHVEGWAYKDMHH